MDFGSQLHGRVAPVQSLARLTVSELLTRPVLRVNRHTPTKAVTTVYTCVSSGWVCVDKQATSARQGAGYSCKRTVANGLVSAVLPSGCSSAWPEYSAWNREVAGSNPAAQTNSAEVRKAGVLIGLENRDGLRVVGVRSSPPPPVFLKQGPVTDREVTACLAAICEFESRQDRQSIAAGQVTNWAS
jgi:hypothetical protein